MVVRPAGDDLVPLVNEGLGHGLRVGAHLGLVGNVFGLHGLVEGDGLGGDDMLERTALDTRKYGRINDLGHFLDDALRGGDAPGIVKVLTYQDDTATGTAEGLVGRGGDDMGVFHRVLQQAGGDKAGGMGHVHHQDGTHPVGDRAHPGIVPFAGIGGGPADDQFRPGFDGHALHLVVIDEAGLLVEAIGDGLVEDAGGVDGRTVGQVTAVGEVEAHERVSRAEDGHFDRQVGLGAGMGLDIGIFGPVDGLEPVNGQLLDLVDDLAAAVIAVTGIALGVFVGADGTHRLQHLVGDIVFRGDQFESGGLAVLFLADEVEYLEILFHRSFKKMYSQIYAKILSLHP